MIEVEMAESGPSTSWPTTSWHHLIKHGRWVRYLAHCCGEMSDKSSSRREFWFTASVYNLSWWAKQDMRQTLTFDLQPRSPLIPAIVTSFCEFHQIMNGGRNPPPMIQATLCDWIYQLRTKLGPSPWRMFHSQMIAGSFWLLIWEYWKS